MPSLAVAALTRPVAHRLQITSAALEATGNRFTQQPTPEAAAAVLGGLELEALAALEAEHPALAMVPHLVPGPPTLEAAEEARRLTGQTAETVAAALSFCESRHRSTRASLLARQLLRQAAVLPF